MRQRTLFDETTTYRSDEDPASVVDSSRAPGVLHWVGTVFAAVVIALLAGGFAGTVFVERTVAIGDGASIRPHERMQATGRTTVVAALRVRLPHAGFGGSDPRANVFGVVHPLPAPGRGLGSPLPRLPDGIPNPAATGHLTRRMPGGPPVA